jgi:hypothetical protein
VGNTHALEKKHGINALITSKGNTRDYLDHGDAGILQPWKR